MDPALSPLDDTTSWAAFVALMRRYDTYCASLPAAPRNTVPTDHAQVSRDFVFAFVWLAYMCFPEGTLPPLFDTQHGDRQSPQETTLERLTVRQPAFAQKLREDPRADHQFAAFLNALSAYDYKEHLWALAESERNSRDASAIVAASG